MSKSLDAFYRFLDEPIFPWARVVLGLLIVAAWTIKLPVPVGDNQIEYQSIASSTAIPWTVIIVLTVVAYLVGLVAVRGMSESVYTAVRRLIMVLWVASFPVIVLVILRDPEVDSSKVLGWYLPLAIGFLVIGLPFAPLFAVLVLIMSVIQLNPILLLLPLAIYVFSFASPVVATIYLVWSLVVGLMDNVLKPMIMGRGSKVPMMVVFLGAIGGFMSSGIVGLFVGAVIVVLGYELFMAWMRAGETDSVDNATSAGETPAA